MRKRSTTKKSAEPTFNERCYSLIQRIPKGRVSTYAEVARALGSNGPRAVGNAMGRNENAPRIPCHRIVKTDGGLGGYAFGVAKKAALLRKEGVAVRGGYVSDFERVFFKLSPQKRRTSVSKRAQKRG